MKNLALIGSGRWGQKYIEESEKIPGCQIKYIRGRDYKDLIEKLHDIDGVIIATPATTHTQIANDFKNIPVLIEKPVAMSTQELLDSEAKKVMAGHTYIYDPEIQKLKDNPPRYLTFRMFNTSRHNSDTSILWELCPHAISLFFYLYDFPDSISVEKSDTLIRIKFFYKHTTCCLLTGWCSNTKERSLSADGDEIILGKHNLRNELIAFMDFIDGKKVPTSSLRHIHAVTNLLSEIEGKM